MARYCDGDAEAFEALYRLVAPRLLSYLVSLIRERATAEDLLQLTFIKLHEARDVYVRGADPLPWMYTIAHRTFLDEARRRGRSKIQLTREGELPELAATTAPLDGKLDDESPLSSWALEALEHLPEQQREALVLTKVHGRSHAEVASITGSTVGAVKLRVHRAYATLRARFVERKGAS